MRLQHAALLLLASLAFTGCATVSKGQPPAKLTTGFWFWDGSSAQSGVLQEPLDELYVQIGAIYENGGEWRTRAYLPDHLPPAKNYWCVYRLEKPAVPGEEVIPQITKDVADLLKTARSGNLPIAGIQLDIDSPTNALPQYAAFLRNLRNSIPHNVQISITALLDWFNNGTAIADVIEQVDEFVPQFYDLTNPNGRDLAVIAGPVDPEWGPIFNRYGKRFRIGISTFGRSRRLRREPSSTTGYLGISRFRDLQPIDIATNPAFELEVKRNRAAEFLLNYRVKQDVRMGKSEFQPGDTIQFILSTPESIQAAMQGARQMGGNLAGVVFFRWPTDNDKLTLRPNEVMTAAGLTSAAPNQTTVDVINGHCAAVECVDVYLQAADLFSSKQTTYRVHTSKPLEYFMPGEATRVRMTGPSQLDVTLPPYCARGRLYLGRAITKKPAEFAVEGQP